MPGHDENLNFSQLISRIRLAVLRYWQFAAVPSIVVFCLGTLLAITLPNYFSVNSVLYMRPQQVTALLSGQKENPSEALEKLNTIQQDIISRVRLRAIIEKFNVYPRLQEQGLIGLEKAIKKMKAEIELAAIADLSGNKENAQTFMLTYSHNNSDIAYRVTDALANLFIEESILSEQAQVTGTREFLEAQLQESKIQLEKTEAKVQEFVSKNFGKLPEHLDQAIAQLENAQRARESNSQIIIAHTQRREFLQSELGLLQQAGLADGENIATQALSSDPRQQLAQLKRALEILKAKYSEKHPDIINTKNRIELLESQIRSGNVKASKGPTGLGVGRDARSIREQMNTLDVEITRLQEENKLLEQKIKKLESDIDAMPVVEQELVKIRRDYATVKDEYEKLLTKSKEAGILQSLVSAQKGAQFQIVEPAVKPLIPTGPNRILIFLGAVIGSLIVFGATAAAFYFLNDAFKSREEVENELQLNVIGVLPPMESPDSLKEKKSYQYASLFLCAFGCFGGGLLIIFLV